MLSTSATHKHHIRQPFSDPAYAFKATSGSASDATLLHIEEQQQQQQPGMQRCRTEHPSDDGVGSMRPKDGSSQNNHEAIAVIGMSFRFPQGAEDPDTFWKILEDRTCTATEFPTDRFNIDAFWDQDPKRPNHIKPRQAHFLEGDIAKFDAGFFSMAPHEVSSMDPQQRGLMETTYHALENAGLTLEDVSGTKTSVHVGCFTNDWAHMQLRDTQNIPKYNAIGSAGSILANRLSWFYNLHGESMYIDTACSSSLIAMALACQGLSSGNSEMAIVGASNLILGPEFNIALSNLNFLSPSGRCKSFSADGDGYGRGEGFTTLILKPVSKAISDGNPIRAVIRSFGMNQDGFTSGGITQPSKGMQAQLIRDTYQKAGLSMAETRFFEAHGTGTAVGDPIEARAIGESFMQYRTDDDPIYVGALKSNFGHLEGTSGLASVVKTVLAVERGIIPPNTNFTTLNPNIDAEFLKLKFPSESIPWPTSKVKRASVNSFGFGGANAHIVVESAEDYLRSFGLQQNVLSLSSYDKSNLNSHERDLRTDDAVAGLEPVTISESGFRSSSPQLLLLSAADEDGNMRQAKALAQYMYQCAATKTMPSGLLEDVLSTLNTRRTLHAWKSYAILESVGDFQTLESTLSKPIRGGRGAQDRLGFVFTGQGAQWPRMGIELLNVPIAEASLVRSQQFLKMLGCPWDLIDEMSAPPESSRIHEPEVSQVISTAVQVALVDMAEYLKIHATAVVGHSSGEIAAAYCVGFLDQESAIKVSYFRGIFANKLSKDADSCRYGMVSVGISADDAPSEFAKLEIIQAGHFEAASLTISCVNSPKNITVSGPVQYLGIVTEYFTAKNIFARKLKVDVGYHSPQMLTVSEQYLSSLSTLKPKDKLSTTHMVSSTTPGRISVEIVCSGEYWVRNMVSPVQFVDAVQLCTSSSENTEVVKKIDQSHDLDVHVQGWLEIGPHSALKGPIREISRAEGVGNIFYTSFLQRGKPADYTSLAAIGELHCSNFHVDLKKTVTLNTACDHQPRIVIDLPKYPFNHSTIYWDESKRSKGFRQRCHGFNPLLGAPVMDWNPLDAKWTWTMKKDELPWVADHLINGDILYPASGMIVMAIEAMKQLLTERNADPLGFELSEVLFLSPLVISDSSAGTEVQLSMVPISTSQGRDAQYKFRIFVMRSDDAWQEICHGLVQADYERTSQSVTTIAEEKLRLLELQVSHHSALKACQKTIGAGDMYEQVATMSGLQYGPTFRPLADIHHDMEGRAYARILPYAPPTHNHSYTIHPSTLDGIFQLAIPSLSEGLRAPLPTLVPSRLTRLWIAASGAGIVESGEEIGSVEAKFLSRRSAQASITVFSQSDPSLRVEVNELEVTEMARATGNSDTEEGALCYEMDWRADHTLLNSAAISQYCIKHRKNYEEPEQYYRDIELMLLGFTAQTLKHLETTGQTPISAMTEYSKWLQARVDSYLESDRFSSALASRPDRHALISSPKILQNLIDTVESQSSRGMVNATVGHHLEGILLGQIDPLQLLFEDDQFLFAFYEELNTAGKAFDMLNSYIDLLVHKNPGLKFLEVGAGTGATTTGVLSVLDRPDCGARYSRYTFTDISASFFSKAQERFGNHGERISYRVFNVEEDPETQGFCPAEQFDVIIAAHVLHATEDLQTTLSNVRKLLKPNGKLIFTEMTTPSKIETGFIFGTLPGWWRGVEQWRKDNASAVCSEAEWDSLLKQTGFTGTEHVFRDWDSDRCHGWSIMVSSANPENVGQQAITKRSTRPPVTLLVDQNSSFEVETAEILKQLLKDMNIPRIMTFNDACQVNGEPAFDCLILRGLGNEVLSDIGEADFKALQKFLTSSRSILWASCARPQSDIDSAPYWAMTEGLCRTFNSENLNVPVTTIILEASTCDKAAKAASKIAKVFRSFQESIPTGSLEPEYRESSGYLCINRLTQAKYLDAHVSARTQKQLKIQQFDSSMPIKLDIRVPGFLDTLQWVEDESAYEPLEPHQVEVKVQAIGVNFKECLILLGRVNTDKLGSECSGLIHRVGSAVSSQHIKVGDRVALGSLESYRSFVRAWDFQVIKIPDTLSFVDAAAIPTAFCTAYHSLINVARLQKNETVLIHAAAGGTGQAAIQVAQHIGAEIFATVGSTDKKDLLMERYGIPEDHIFYSRDSSFADGIRRMTKGEGIDVVLNSLSGKLLVASWELMANFGRFVEIGRKDIDSRGHLPMHPFIRNATFNGVDLATIVENPAQKDKYCLQEVFDLVQQGVFRPSYPVQPYPIDQAEQALRVLQSGKSSGKIVLEATEGAMIPLQEGSNSSYRFLANATYVIVGGFGGIGRQIATWMAKRGAKNILILSRSGLGLSKEKRRVVADLEAAGVNVRYDACDISDHQALENTIRLASSTMPPIKGCFQAAMVLRDRPFSTMSYVEWVQSVRPKVQGSWNLHTVLPSRMDFFIMLASTSGIFGNAGQSNYAAGNTFLDALAQYRTAIGEKAVALDLGMILGEGFVAENRDIRAKLLRLNLLQPLKQEQIFAIFDFYCNPDTKIDSTRASQIVTGIELPASILQSGREVPEALQRKLFGLLHQIQPNGTIAPSNTTNTQDLPALLREAATVQNAAPIISETLKNKLCKIVGVDSNERSVNDRMESFGVDSLLALELRNWLLRDVRADLAVFELLGDLNLKDIGLLAARKSLLLQKGPEA